MQGAVVQLGGLVPGYPWVVPHGLMLISLFYSQKVPLKLKINLLVWYSIGKSSSKDKAHRPTIRKPNDLKSEL